MFRRLHPSVTLVLLLGLVHVALSIKCMECFSKDDTEESCDARGYNETCLEQKANTIFEHLRSYQPAVKAPRRNTGYQCMEMRYADGHQFFKGCIYANLDPCVEIPNTKHCMTCKEDYCNAKWYKDGGAIRGGSFALVAALAWIVVMVCG